MKYTLSILLAIVSFFITMANGQTAQSANEAEETLKISTNLIQLSFIPPNKYESKYTILDGEKPVDNFQILKPEANNKLRWVLLLDLNDKTDFKAVNKQIKTAAKNLDAPTVIITSQGFKNDNFKKRLIVPENIDLKIVSNLDEAFRLAAHVLNSSETYTRKALFMLSTNLEGITSDTVKALPRELQDESTFVFLTSVPAVKTNNKLVYSNLILNTIFTVLDQSILTNVFFKIFADQAKNLHTLFYMSDDDKDAGEGKIYIDAGNGKLSLLQSKKYGEKQ